MERQLEDGNPDDGTGSAPVIETIGELFYAALPYYLNYGMTASEFWDGDVWLAPAYRTAYDLRRKEKNFFCWLNGQYVYTAIGHMSPALNALAKDHKPIPFPEQPFALTAEEAEWQEEQRMRRNAERGMQMLQMMQQSMLKNNRQNNRS